MPSSGDRAANAGTEEDRKRTGRQPQLTEEAAFSVIHGIVLDGKAPTHAAIRAVLDKDKKKAGSPVVLQGRITDWFKIFGPTLAASATAFLAKEPERRARDQLRELTSAAISELEEKSREDREKLLLRTMELDGRETGLNEREGKLNEREEAYSELVRNLRREAASLEQRLEAETALREKAYSNLEEAQRQLVKVTSLAERTGGALERTESQLAAMTVERDTAIEAQRIAEAAVADAQTQIERVRGEAAAAVAEVNAKRNETLFRLEHANEQLEALEAKAKRETAEARATVAQREDEIRKLRSAVDQSEHQRQQFQDKHVVAMIDNEELTRQARELRAERDRLLEQLVAESERVETAFRNSTRLEAIETTLRELQGSISAQMPKSNDGSE